VASVVVGAVVVGANEVVVVVVVAAAGTTVGEVWTSDVRIATIPACSSHEASSSRAIAVPSWQRMEVPSHRATPPASAHVCGKYR